MFPCSGIDKAGYHDKQEKTNSVLFWMKSVKYLIAATGLIIVFGFYRKQTKPTFIKAIWAFITIGILTSIPLGVLWLKWEKLT